MMEGKRGDCGHGEKEKQGGGPGMKLVFPWNRKACNTGKLERIKREGIRE